MKGYIKFINSLPVILQIILALPVLDGLVFGIYRICKGAIEKNIIMVILGVLWIVLGTCIGAIIDIISIIMYKKVKILA